MRFVKAILVLALVFAVSAIAYAETQSVKVSGDLTMRAFARDNYDLDSNDVQNARESNDWATFLTNTAEVQIDADLTDNVSGVIRLINQRVWGDNAYVSSAAGQELMNIDDNGTPAVRNVGPGTNAFDVELDLAYIELKEFLYSPLTLRIGRQDLWFGKGFIIGANIQDNQANLYAQEYSAVRSFDAIRATLDYDPWTIDGIMAKIAENARRADDDILLYGVNVGYVFDEYNGEAEAYWFWKQSRNPGGAAGISLSSVDGRIHNDIHTFGLRGSFDPIEDWTIALEGAYQFGDFLYSDANVATSQAAERDRNAWAVDASIECRYWQDDFAWRPVIGVEYIFYSGENEYGDQTVNSAGKWHGWDKMYRGKFDTAIREYMDWFYRTGQATADGNYSPAWTNQHQLLVRGSIEPTDSLTVEALYGHFWLAEKFSAVRTNKDIGDEVDINITWDYTEDVQFGLLTAWFFPGDHFASDFNDAATDIVGSVKLSF